MTHFTFSIKQAIRDSWTIFKETPWFFVALTFLMLLINIVSNEDNALLALVGVVAAVIFGYMWASISLAAVDGKKELIGFSTIGEHLPSVKHFFYIIGVGLVVGLFTILGLIALIIPGLYIAVRLGFASLAYVDRKNGVMESVRFSWNLVKKDVFWKVVLVFLTVFGLTILGVLALGVGIFIAYPITMFLTAKLYRALVLYRNAPAAVVVEIEEDDKVIEVREVETEEPKQD